MLTLFLLLMLPLYPQDCCGMVEISHVYGPDGSLTFDQLICYEFNATASRWDVRDWRLIPDGRVSCETAKREWNKSHPNGPPYEPKWIGSPMVPRKSNGTYRCVWFDKKCGVRREIAAKQVRETWTSYDPELLAREDLPETERRRLR